MVDILFIKTSSLGDVIHQMPAIAEARRHRPVARLSWIVEEAFAPLARLHPAVDEVIPVAWRRWRGNLGYPSTWSDVRAFAATIRACRRDEVIDTQGLLRSALIARLARGRRHGFDAASVREPLASLFYDVRHRVGRDLHAIERNRMLTGLALGYALEGAFDYGLGAAGLADRAAGRYAILLHATARAEKEWPEDRWIEVGSAPMLRDLDLLLPWGTAAERARSERLASALPQARVAERKPLDAVARMIAGASLVLGVDTGLLHMAAALGVPLVAIFAGSNPHLTGPMGAGPIEIVGQKGCQPTARDVMTALERIRPRWGSP
jgi:heptosyltransferase I